VVASRSGETTESVLAAERFARKFPGRVIVVTCASTSSISTHAGFVVEVPSGSDQALPQTRSYAAMLQVALMLFATLAGRTGEVEELRLAPAALEASILTHAERATALGRGSGWSSAVFLGTGAAYGSAREGSLKLIEMATTKADALPFLEVRHGPNAIIGAETLVVGLASYDSVDAEAAVLDELRRQEARIAACVPSELAARMPSADTFLFDDVSELLLPFAYLPVLQFIALGRAQTIGANPDAPPHVRRFVTVDDLEPGIRSGTDGKR
jgi:glucosamine--fructose-6-phosphate aminotransferase (isomerizing)